MPTGADFRAELEAQISRALKQNRPHIEVNSGELHRIVGGYPRKAGEHDHSMPTCCWVMEQEFKKGGAVIIHQPPRGHGAALTIRYDLPRPDSISVK